MKRWPIFLLLLASPLSADTYIYRVNINQIPVNTVKVALATSTYTTNSEPYINLSVMSQPDTNYVLVSVTPKDGQNFNLDKKVAGVKLQKVIDLDSDGSFFNKVDNTGLFPSTWDWTVLHISS